MPGSTAAPLLDVFQDQAPEPCHRLHGARESALGIAMPPFRTCGDSRVGTGSGCSGSGCVTRAPAPLPGPASAGGEAVGVACCLPCRTHFCRRQTGQGGEI